MTGAQPKTVVVGVKLDSHSKELLTWALVKVADPGDHVIAVHVLDSVSEETSCLLSLVKTFDSVLSAYEGFCSLKQVDLKLKVCRGNPIRKILAREAQAFHADVVIVGPSKTHHRIRSSVAVAKYCAWKLPKSFSVFAIDNGKVVFKRDEVDSNTHQLQGNNRKSSMKNVEVLEDVKVNQCEKKSLQTKCQNCEGGSVLLDNSGTQLPGDETKDESLALVPFQSLNSVKNQRPHCFKPGWSILRWTFLRRQQHKEKSPEKTSVLGRFSKPLSSHTSAVVHPDQKHSNSSQDGDHSSMPDGISEATVSLGSNESFPPLTPNHGMESLPEEFLELCKKYSSSCRLFSYEELLLATSNFLPENMVGKGGSSHVYRGHLSDGKELAVKILKPSADILKEFVHEIEIITTLNHKNIISLYGLCFDNNLVLVYDFISRGSLEDNLHGNKKDGNSFSWHDRYNVALGVAEALNYLHNGCEEPVIHRDVKSSNILLSDDFEPQLSDFGLASLASTSSHIDCTDVAGTFGYLAPEYFMHGKVSDKIDVYAFGVVLLELLSGRQPIYSKCPKDQESLVMWAKPILKGGEVAQLLDPSMGSDYDHDQIERMVVAANLCIRHAPGLRPEISTVLKLLQGDEEITRWARQQVSASDELDALDGEVVPTNIKSHLNMALLDLEDDSLSTSSGEQSISVEEYLQGRWSRSTSFD
ncbi:PREDICTED: probable receptor-like serine/threonine-protein kinase At5g57670 [Fragaria vesca subsp. vesca]|uniref:probable receptor-like serine/threonine-protein kinase At5g57670 n=1 Tax=Fragaria vesca subsp. vesca TaxID=101020 RepID=UPI0002C3732B|nr:PREDICTED: probable receptor-like serine/threonine-protein kinase At5g57670 [Fragaria vesca subsp. vesca]